MGRTTGHGQELDDHLTGIEGSDGLMSVVGFGSLMSKRSAEFTFPELQNFREARLRGFRRVFAHVAPIFLVRGIARLDTKEMSSLSVEPTGKESDEIVVSLFEVPKTEAAVVAWLDREHEFRFLAVHVATPSGAAEPRMAVVCARYDEEEYKARRCPPDEFERRYGQYGVHTIWRDDVLPCRTYLRHCTLASERLSPAAHESFLDATFLADRSTTVRQHLAGTPSIMQELPPPELAARYCG